MAHTVLSWLKNHTLAQRKAPVIDLSGDVFVSSSGRRRAGTFSAYRARIARSVTYMEHRATRRLAGRNDDRGSQPYRPGLAAGHCWFWGTPAMTALMEQAATTARHCCLRDATALARCFRRHVAATPVEANARAVAVRSRRGRRLRYTVEEALTNISSVADPTSASVVETKIMAKAQDKPNVRR